MTESATARPDDGGSPGALIRAARERQGLHIAALAAAIKVSPRKLDALENDRWHELPDATFSRALAQTVCRYLKIDPRPVLERLPPADGGSLEQVAGSLNMPFQDRQGRAGSGLSAAAIRPMVWASGLLAVAAVVVYLLPPDWLGGSTPASDPGTASDTLLPPLPLPSTQPVPASAPASSPASAPAPSGTTPASLSALPAGTVPQPLPGAAPTTVAAVDTGPAGETVFSAPTVAADAAVAGGALALAEQPPAGPVQLRASDASWVEARDASGQLLLSRTVLPGETVGLNGALPMQLVIGNAAATELGFRGRDVDLAPLTRNNVARVELR